MQSAAGYKLVRLANGAQTVHALSYGETMHPGLGPVAEAEALYVGQLKLRERLARHEGEFVIWDVGLGAAANALTVLRTTRDLACPLRIVSFDNTLEPLAFALTHKESLGYLDGYEAQIAELLRTGTARCAVRTPQRGVPTTPPTVEFMNERQPVVWEFHLGDFPTRLDSETVGRDSRRVVHDLPSPAREYARPTITPPPHAILFDAFSPAKNPAMWTLPLFTNLFGLLDPRRPCALTTYSRSTMFRVTLLLAGFFVGQGQPTGLKEETTVAANTLELIDEPLDRLWLTRAQRSGSAEPLHEPVYRQAPLSPMTWERLQQHPQFR